MKMALISKNNELALAKFLRHCRPAQRKRYDHEQRATEGVQPTCRKAGASGLRNAHHCVARYAVCDNLLT